MQLEVLDAADDDRTIVRRLLQYYHYDFSEFDGTDVNAHGEYLHRFFDEYWMGADRQAFLFRVDGNWAGLALVFTGEPHDVAEFFVMRKYRKVDVGRRAAAVLFTRFPGRWTVRQQLVNPAATAFWRRAIPWPFDEVEHEGEVVQSFATAPSRLCAVSAVAREERPGVPASDRRAERSVGTSVRRRGLAAALRRSVTGRARLAAFDRSRGWADTAGAEVHEAAGGVAMRSPGRFAILAFAALAISAWGPGSVAADRPVLVAAATPNPTPPPWSASSHNYSDGDYTLNLAHQQAMRIEFGLRHDPAYIRAVDAGMQVPNMILGVPMTPAEVREMEHRNVVGMQLAALGEKLAQAEPATFAGVWLDQAAGGVPVIASTQPADIDRALVASELPAGVHVQFRAEQFSSQYLNALAAKIENDAQDGYLASFGTLSVGAFIMENEVRVDLPSAASPTDVAAVYARYGPQGLTVERDAGALF